MRKRVVGSVPQRTPSEYGAGGMRVSVAALYPLSQSRDHRLYAEATRGRGAVCYFSAGQVGSAPAFDMVYALGGYLWVGEPPAVCWVGLDAVYGATLVLWRPDSGLRRVYQTALPRVIQLKGRFPDDTILLEEGFLQQDFTITPSRYVLVNLSDASTQTMDDAHRFMRPLPRYQAAWQPSRNQQTTAPATAVGEYLGTDEQHFFRIASSEGEMKLGSVWHVRSGVVQRASSTLRDVSAMAWHPSVRDAVVASTNAIYGQQAAVYRWEPRTARWRPIRVFAGTSECRIVALSGSVAKVRLTAGNRVREVEIRL